MLYESYKTKLEKRKRRFERFWRFRLLYLLVLLMLFAFAGAMMGVAGTVTEVSVPTRFTYGEPLSMQASTVFGGADFEFRLQGTEAWNKTFPRAAGTYECRAVGKSVAGTDRPGGEIFSFTIDPIKTVVRVQEADLMYGDKPTFAANLCYDDELRVSKYSMEEEEGGYHIVADLDAVSIVNAEGEDVTASYDVEVAERDVNEIAREITVHTASASAVYSGQPFSAEEWEIVSDHGLAEGHRIEEVKFGSITDAGTKVNACEYHILDENDEDVTGKYKITEDFGDLTVTPRPVTVTTESDRFTYNGTAHTYEKIEADAETPLAEGQSLRRAAPLSAKNAGEYTNAPAFDILDAEGNSVKSNYAITEKFGTVTIDKVEITVTMTGETFTYDGTVHEYNTEEWYTVEGAPVEGERLEFTGTLSARDAKTYVSKPTVKVFAQEVETSGNYSIEVIEAEVIVNKRAVTVKTMGDKFPYDGKEHTYEDIEAEGLAKGQSVKRTNETRAKDWKAGGYENAPEFDIVDEAGNSAKSNYKITEIFGTVIINKIKITVTMTDDEFTYDGKAHIYTADMEGAYTVEGALADGEEITYASDILTAKNAGDYENKPVINIVAGETDTTKNYVITQIAGKVHVEKRTVYVKTEGAEFTYDGTDHEYNDIKAEDATSEDDGLAEGQRIARSDIKTWRNAGKYTNTAEFEIYDEANEKTTDNYEITTDFGTVIINKRPIEITTQSHEFIYDGTAHSYDKKDAGYFITEKAGDENYGLLSSIHTLTVSKATKVTNVNDGAVTNELEFEITDKGVPVTDNYDITVKNTGEISVVKRPVTLKTGSLTGEDSVTYDAKEHGAPSYSAVGTQLADGHKLATSYSVWIDAGTYTNSIDEKTAKIEDADGNDVTSNYDLKWEWGTVTINKRQVKLQTDSLTVTYDAKPHGAATYFAVSELDLVAGHTVEAAFQTWINANEDGYENSFDITKAEIHNQDGVDVTSNYEPHWEWGTVVIKKRHVTVTSDSQTGSESWVYDGREHSLNKFKVEETNGERGLAEGHTYTATTHAPFFTNVNETRDQTGNNVLAYSDEFIGVKGGENCIENYDITYENGTVTITPREITVTTEDHSFTYNGVEHTYKDIKADGLAPGQSVKRTNDTHAKNWKAGGYENAAEFDILDENNISTKENYKITEKFGTIIVNKRAVTVTTKPDEFTYNGEDHYYNDIKAEDATSEDDGLAEGQEIRRSDTKTWRNAGKYTNTPEYEIYDEANEKTTDNYEITTDFGTVIINKRPIHVKTASPNPFTYDGILHEYLEDTLIIVNKDVPNEGLAKNQELHIDRDAPNSYYAFKEASNKPYINHPVLYISDGKDDVSSNYVWEYGEDDYGKITINFRPLHITSGTSTYVYDDTAHEDRSYTITDKEENTGLASVDGKSIHTLTVIGAPTIIDVGMIVNELYQYYRITDENGEDVTKNYDIDETTGTITVTKRKVKILTGSLDNIVYDGDSHSAAYFTSWNRGEGWSEEGKPYYPLAPGHKLSIVYPEFVETSFGQKGNKYINEPLSFSIAREDGSLLTNEEIQKNYDIDWEYGTVEILRRKVKIETHSGSYVYDARSHTVETYTDWDGDGFYKLVSGHTVTAEYAAMTNVWETEAGNNKWTDWKVWSGGIEVTKNYDPESVWVWGTITITPRPVTITSGEGTHVYDDTDYSLKTYTTEEFNKENQTGLVAGHQPSVTVTDAPVLHDVGSALNELKYTITVTADGVDVTDNYVFDGYYAYSMIAVTPRPLTITTPSGTHVYDGNPLELKECTPEAFNEEASSGLVTWHEFLVEYTKWNAITTVQSLSNEMTLKITIRSGEKEVTGNYELRYQWGTLEVTKRPMTVVLDGGTWVYFGEEKACENFHLEGGMYQGKTYGVIVLKEDVQIAFHKFLNADTYTNGCDEGMTVIVNANMTQNFDISYNYDDAEVIITPRLVKITTGTSEHVYDGKPFSFREYTAEEFDQETQRGIVKRHTFSADYASVTNVWDCKEGNNTVDIETARIFDGMADVTGNYILEWQWGTITITRRPITITSKGGTWAYDGLPHSAQFDIEQDNEKDPRGLLQGHVLTVLGKEVTGITDTLGEDGLYVFGDVANAFEDEDVKIVLTDYDGVSVRDNYEIIKGDLGRLRVQSPIYVLLANRNKQYDGTSLAYDPSQVNYRIITLPAGLPEEWVYITLGGSITEIGSLTAAQVLAQSICTVMDAEEHDLTAQNRFIFVGGNPKDPKEDATVLTVKKRTLTIQTINMTVRRTEEGSKEERDYFVDANDASLYNLTFNTLLPEHTLRCTMTGRLLLTETSAKNELLKENVHVYDGGGREVTEFYDIKIIEGTIKWLEETNVETGTNNINGGIGGREALPPEDRE